MGGNGLGCDIDLSLLSSGSNGECPIRRFAVGSLIVQRSYPFNHLLFTFQLHLRFIFSLTVFQHSDHHQTIYSVIFSNHSPAFQPANKHSPRLHHFLKSSLTLILITEHFSTLATPHIPTLRNHMMNTPPTPPNVNCNMVTCKEFVQRSDQIAQVLRVMRKFMLTHSILRRKRRADNHLKIVSTALNLNKHRTCYFKYHFPRVYVS